MNKYLEIIIIVVFFSATLFSLKVALGGSPDYSKVIKEANNHLEAQTQAPYQNNAIDHSINNTMQLCAITFDTGLNLSSKYSILCDKIMITLDKQCRDSYYTFCFGSNWVNFEKQKHVNPPYCKSKTNSKGLDC